MTYNKTRWVTMLALLTVGVLVLSLVPACQSKSTTEIEGVVQATDGQDVILTLPDGTKIRVGAEKQVDDASNLIGEDVKAKIEVGDDNPKLVELEKAAGVPGLKASTDFHFSGSIESMGAAAWSIGGRTFKVNPATILDNGLATGVPAEVEFINLSDGSLLATKIETQVPDITQDFSLTGVIGSINANQLVLGGKTFKVDANTMLDNGLGAGVLARVEFVVQPDGSFLALEIETDAPDTLTAGTPLESGENFTASGPIQSMDSVSVTVDGKKFTIDANTILDNGLATGVLAKVEFVVKSDGTLVAKEVETAKIDEGVNFYFAGPIESMGTTAWVIGGKTFAITPKTILDEGLGLGVNANVEFIIGAGGSLQALHIEDTGFEFTGLVQAITPGAYTIGGKIFKTNANTLIDQGLKVRKMAQVDFIIQADGSLLALKIKTAKTKVQGFNFKGVVQSLSATSITVTGQTFQVSPTTTMGAGVATGSEVNVVFDIKPGNILSAISVQSATAAPKK
ncbi:MAG: hypothetical protein HYX81_02110 [Chloroflexi bacterium]|nr:hypothetical protein [Chloroflexota bacterium]